MTGEQRITNRSTTFLEAGWDSYEKSSSSNPPGQDGSVVATASNSAIHRHDYASFFEYHTPEERRQGAWKRKGVRTKG
jgi:hypothetical protein